MKKSKKFNKKLFSFAYSIDIGNFIQGFVSLLQETYPFLKGSIKLKLNIYNDLTTYESFGFKTNYSKWNLNLFEKVINNKVISTGKTEYVKNVFEESLAETLLYIFKIENIKSFIAIPIVTPWEIIGVLNLYTNQEFSDNFLNTLDNHLNLFGTIAYLLWKLQNSNQKKIIFEEEIKKLKELTNFYNMIIENIPFGLIATDKKGYVLLVNSELEKMSKIKRENIIGRKWFNAFGFQGETREKLELTFWTDKLHYFPEIYLGLVDGGVSPVEMVTSILKDKKNNKIGVLATCRNLLEKRKMENDIMKLDQFYLLNRIAHGFANKLLTKIIEIKDTTQSLKNNPEVNIKTYLSKVEDEVKNISLFLENFISSSNIMIKPKALMPKELVNINSIINNLLFSLSEIIKSKKIKIYKNLSNDLPDIMIDNYAIEQALKNIIINAIEAEQEKGQITIESFIIKKFSELPENIYWQENFLFQLKDTQNLDNQYICVTIKDNGEGIHPDNLFKIFEPFFTTRPDKTGIGLYFANQIIKKHQGLIGLDTSFKKGTKFYILISC